LRLVRSLALTAGKKIDGAIWRARSISSSGLGTAMRLIAATVIRGTLLANFAAAKHAPAATAMQRIP